MIFHILQQFTNIFIYKCGYSSFYDLHTYNIFAEIYEIKKQLIEYLLTNN